MSPVVRHRRCESLPNLKSDVELDVSDDVSLMIAIRENQSSPVLPPVDLALENQENAFIDSGRAKLVSQAHSYVKKVVFVGNLPVHQSEDAIRHQLEMAFNGFGSRNMTLHLSGEKPYAFIEFETGEQAYTAQQQCHGVRICGREIRTEIATARSTGFFRKLSGQEISVEELLAELHGCNLVKYWAATDSDRAIFNLPLGWFVDFGNHENFKKVAKLYGQSKIYHFDSLNGPTSVTNTFREKWSSNVPTKSRSKPTHLQQSWRKETLVAFLKVSTPPTVACDLAILQAFCQERLTYHPTDSPLFRAITFSTHVALERALQAFPNLVFRTLPMGIQSLAGGRAVYQRQDPPFIANQQMFLPAPIVQARHWSSNVDNFAPMYASPLHANAFDNDAETVVGAHEDPTLLNDVTIGSGVTISDYGTDIPMTGRLIGHFAAIEHGSIVPTRFHLDNLVYIEDSFGVKHIGYLLGSVAANFNLQYDFQVDGMPRMHPGCPHHGLDCVLGRYMAESAKEGNGPNIS